MTYITRTVLRMVLLLACLAAGAVWMHKELITNFLQNSWLNGLIFFVIIIGLVASFRLIFILSKEQAWLNRLLSGRERVRDTSSRQLTILTPFSLLIQDDALPSHISPLNARSVLSSIEWRLDSLRDLSRYCTGLLVFLGLLGTFWGLSQTVIGISGIIGGIDVDSGNAIDILKKGLSAPLAGMGTAFSCSMFGLAGSLVVGFLDLQVGRAFSAFFNQCEEILSQLTRFSSFSSGAEVSAAGSGPAFSLGLLEQAIEGMAALHNQLRKNEDTRLTMTKSIQLFSEKLSEMSEYMMAHQGFSQRLAQNQIELQETMLSQSKDGAQGRNEEIIKTHIRSIDATLSKLLEESIEGRGRSVNDIKSEIRVVTRTLSAIANGQDVSA